MPIRIQRKRTKGFRLQGASPNGLPVVYVGRLSMWGNPFGGSHLVFDDKVGKCVPERLRAYREWVVSGIEGRSAHTGHFWGACDAAVGYPDRTKLIEGLPHLTDKNLACWCPLEDKDGNPVPCHADVLLAISNGWKDWSVQR